MESKCKVVITGATGCIGTALLRYCDTNNVDAYAIIRPGSKRIVHIPKSEHIKIIECALGEYVKLEQMEQLKGCQYLFHLAWNGTFGEARDQVIQQEKNVEYTLAAVRLAEKIGCEGFLFAGSQAEFGRTEEPLNQYVPTNPESEYGKAKLKAGQQSAKLCKELGLRFVYTRILSVYGPSDGSETMVMSTIAKLQKGEIPAFTPAQQMWDYIYSDDAATALFLLAKYGKEDKIYCIGSGKQLRLCEYIEVIRQVVNKDVKLEYGKLPYRENQVMSLCADISDLVQDTGFSPRVSFREGIELILKNEEDE